METLHFTLAHFNYDIHRIMFHETGYTSLNDYELNTTNSIFELSWNNYTGLFEREASSLEVKHLDPSQFYHRFVPMSSLCFDVKTYLFERFLSNSSYRCFEDYYINNYRQLADILVFVPWKSVRSVVVEDKNVKITVKFPFNPIVEAENTLDGFSFKLNGNNKKYILYSKDDKLAHPERYSSSGWQLFEGKKPIFYREKYGGFSVCKKFKDQLRQLGAKYIPRQHIVIKE